MQAFIGAFAAVPDRRSCWCVAACRRCVGTAAVVGPPLAFHATLFAMPGLYTTDMFSYVMYSHIAGVLQVNPYTSVPSWFPEVRIFHWIHPLWHNAPSIYGPAWIDLTLPLARAVATASEVDKVLAYKALVNVGHLFGVGLPGVRRPPGAAGQRARSRHAVRLEPADRLRVRRQRPQRRRDGRRDAARRWRSTSRSARWLGMVAVTISMLLKMTSLFLLPYYAMAWAREQPSLAPVLRRRHPGRRSPSRS